MNRLIYIDIYEYDTVYPPFQEGITLCSVLVYCYYHSITYIARFGSFYLLPDFWYSVQIDDIPANTKAWAADRRMTEAHPESAGDTKLDNSKESVVKWNT